MPTLWAKTVEFDKIAVGDRLPILVKWETEHTIRRFVAPQDQSEDQPEDQPDDEDESKPPDNLPEAALTGYVSELLEKAFPYERLSADGSRFEVTTLHPVRLGDTTGISGRVTGKREEDGRRLVDCEIVIDVDGQGIAAQARAVVSL